MGKHHELKINHPYYDMVLAGTMRFQIRNNDRDFHAGDTVELRSYDPINQAFSKTAKPLTFRIGGLLTLDYFEGLKPITPYGKHVIFSLLPLEGGAA